MQHVIGSNRSFIAVSRLVCIPNLRCSRVELGSRHSETLVASDPPGELSLSGLFQ